MKATVTVDGFTVDVTIDPYQLDHLDDPEEREEYATELAEEYVLEMIKEGQVQVDIASVEWVGDPDWEDLEDD